MSDNIKVVVKVRPLIYREIEDKLFYQWRVKNNTLYQIDQKGKEYGQSFTFDKVYDNDAKTTEVFSDIAKPIVEAAIAGMNGTIFAYGQTSSGKTYTMTGTDDSPGIIPLAVLNLFDTIKSIPNRDFLVRVSYVEIYNERLIDLFNVKKNVKIHEVLTGIKVDTTEKVTSSPEEVFEFMKEGKANRHAASTNMNDESSRSHSIFQITIESRVHIEGEEEVGSVNISQLNLVDLAGSERAGQTGATGLRFIEGTHINKSLSTLALVIKQLSEGQNKHVSYRDSKLTRLLQNSLGGNAKTSIICAVTPAVVEETISTLQFAYRAKAIRNRPEVNAVETSESMIQTLTKQLCFFKAELENKKNVEQANCNLQKEITKLQKLILNGFHQRTSDDLISGARKKLCQPRRMTISTLHPIQENVIPDTIPKFCTPSLKYNDVLIPGISDLAPLRASESLSCLPEQPTRSITQPAKDKEVYSTNDEIIELDSDDEDSPTDVGSCSPYHICFDTSKTPPCILRRNYKEAEKNCNDIIKFTDREKLYPPDAAELMKKLDEKSSIVYQLEKDFNTLNEICKSKDEQITELQETINLSEIKLKEISEAKIYLDKICNEYQIKLTDCEVSYESLMKKSKNREKELLSLLEEQQLSKHLKDNVTMYSPPKSQEQGDQIVDCTSPTLNSSDSSFVKSHIKDMPFEIQELSLKEQTIIELQATITAHVHNIKTLENVNKELKTMIADYRDNFLLIENENEIYKSKINDLNSVVETLKKQVDNLGSYKDVINEESPINTIIADDKNLLTMIKTEGSFITNNENINNVSQSLKNILDSKIKASINNSEMSYNNTETINSFEGIKNIQDQLQEKIGLLQNLTEEFVVLQSKNVEIEVAKTNLESINAEYCVEIQRLKVENDKLNSEVVKIKEELKDQDEVCKSKNIQMSLEINRLEEDIKLKNISLDGFKRDLDINSGKFKMVVKKLQEIILLLSGNIQDIPDLIEDFGSIFEVLRTNIISLLDAVKNVSEDKKCLQSLINKYETKISLLQETVDNVSEITSVALNDFVEVTMLNNGIGTQKDSESKCELLNKIKALISTTKDIHCKLNETIQIKDKEINKLKKDVEESEVAFNNKSKESADKSKELHAILEQNDNLFHNILDKVMSLSSINIEKISLDYSDNKEFSKCVLILINNIVNYTETILSNQESEKLKTLKSMAEIKAEVKHLNEENLKISKDLSDVEKEKCVLTKEIKAITNNKEKVMNDLLSSNKILGELQNDLKEKSIEIEMLKNKAESWKEKFITIDMSMNRQLDELELENTRLREDLRRLTSRESIIVETNFKSHSFERIQGNSEHIVDVQSPQSLLTICCEKILDTLQPHDNEQSASSVNSNNSLQDLKINPTCNCLQLKSEIQMLQTENDKFRKKLHNLQIYNENLVKEIEDTKTEVRLLLNSTYELRKKICNHRTNLSTLNATMYAENKSLSSQLKSLQHYHSLFYKSCDKDVPEIKKQLQELMELLKNDITLKNNDCLRRLSLPTTLGNNGIKTSNCESMLDGDLLMLDTNITTTTCDNTLTGHDQSGFNAVCAVEGSCQTNSCGEMTEIDDPPLERSEINILKLANASVESLKLENHKLHEMVEEYKINKENNIKCFDSQNSSKLAVDVKSCEKCIKLQESLQGSESIENDTLRYQLCTMTNQKCDLEAKFKTLEIDVASIHALQIKVKNLEKDLESKSIEISKLASLLIDKNKNLENLQEENDTLSNQIMDNIHEADTLKHEINLLKQNEIELCNKYSKLEDAYDILKVEKLSSNQCRQCLEKDDVIKSLHITPVAETVSRYNKICTLQSEIHAGKEDCKELKNEVTNIKNHLDKNNMSLIQSMDLDETLGDSDLINLSKSNCGLNVNNTDISEERPSDIYTLDKVDCISYCIEKTGLDKETFNCDMKMIDVIKLLYTDLYTKHNNKMENIINKLKDFEESKHLLQDKCDNLVSSQEKMTKDLEEKNMYLQEMANLVGHIKTTLNFLDNQMNESELSEVLDLLKNSFFARIDEKFGSVSLNVFNNLINLIEEHYKIQIIKLTEENNTQLMLMDKVKELDTQIEILKSELFNKEKEYGLLQMKKEKIFEISNAVTLDIVNREKTLYDVTKKMYIDLVSKDLIQKEILDMSKIMPIDKIISILNNNLVENSLLIKEKNNTLTTEINYMKTLFDEKNKELHTLQEELNKVNEVNKQMSEALKHKEEELKNRISIHDLLKCTYDKKNEENNSNVIIIANLTEQVNIIKNTIECREATIKALETQLHSQKQTCELTSETSKELQLYKDEIEKLKSINNILIHEKDSATVELQRANVIIEQNKTDLEKTTSDLLILKETIDQSSNNMETLRMECKKSLEQATQLKDELKEKTKELLRLETNIKTYQKSAQIQCKMISRLKKEKSSMEESNSDHVKKNKELAEMLDQMKSKDDMHVKEINSLKNIKERLETRISELEKEEHSKQEKFIEMNDSKSRRQNHFVSLRSFSDNDDDHKEAEALFKTRQCGDLSMDVDDGSTRSTPVKLSKPRDSLSSKHDQSDKDGSRSGSMEESRRRRQSIYDARRSISTLETLQRTTTDRNNESTGSEAGSEILKLRKQLEICQEELVTWKEKFREVDEECEICASYLRDKELQLRELDAEKKSLLMMIEELKQKLKGVNHTTGMSVDVAVNTEEDWANLHSIVVDRMSYDAVVDKNKNLSKTIDKLRCQKQELKNTLSKIQKSLEKNQLNERELEVIKSDLKTCQAELAEVKKRNCELDEECNICSEYLKERDEQIKKLIRAKKELENKLLDYQDSSVCVSLRKKRQNMHDFNRHSNGEVVDAATETCEELYSHVQIDEICKASDLQAKELERAQKMVEKLTQQKANLEEQLVVASNVKPVYVSTGSAIVQQQQFSDVVKENQRLKSVNAKLTRFYRKAKLQNTYQENDDPAAELNI